MICAAVIMGDVATINVAEAQAPTTIFGADAYRRLRHVPAVLSSADLLNEMRRLKDEGRTTNADLARLLGLPSARIAEIFDEKRRVTIDEMKTVVEHFALGGAVEARRLPTTIDKAPDAPPVHSADAGEMVEITRLDLSLPMGPGAVVDDFIENEPLTFDAAYVRSFTRTPPHRLRLAAGAGDSMFPTLVPNDLVWIDTTQNQLLHADRIYAASINGGAAIKRLRPVAGGRRILVVSDNKTVEPYEVEADEVVIWGRVIRYARDL